MLGPRDESVSYFKSIVHKLGGTSSFPSRLLTDRTKNREQSVLLFPRHFPCWRKSRSYVFWIRRHERSTRKVVGTSHVGEQHVCKKGHPAHESINQSLNWCLLSQAFYRGTRVAWPSTNTIAFLGSECMIVDGHVRHRHCVTCAENELLSGVHLYPTSRHQWETTGTSARMFMDKDFCMKSYQCDDSNKKICATRPLTPRMIELYVPTRTEDVLHWRDAVMSVPRSHLDQLLQALCKRLCSMHQAWS